MLFFTHFSLTSLPHSPTCSSLFCFFLALIFVPSPTTQTPHHQAPFLVFAAGESLYIVVSSWIWKPHSEVNIREVWQQQSALTEGRIKPVRRCVFLWKGGPLYSVYWHCLWLGRRLWWGDQKLLLRLWLLGILKFPLKVSLPSNYILRFISAFR